MATKSAKTPAAKKSPKKLPKKFEVAPFIASLPPEAATTQPSLPVSVATLEAQRLYKEAQKSRAQLRALPGLEVANLDTSPGRVAALDSAQRAWLAARIDRQSNSLEGSREQAEALRGTLMAAGRYLLRKDASARANRFALALGDGVDGDAANAAQAHRNQVYAVLEQAVGEVREAARFVFRAEPKKPSPMLSHFEANRKRARRNKKGKSEASDSSAATPNA